MEEVKNQMYDCVCESSGCLPPEYMEASSAENWFTGSTKLIGEGAPWR